MLQSVRYVQAEKYQRQHLSAKDKDKGQRKDIISKPKIPSQRLQL